MALIDVMCQEKKEDDSPTLMHEHKDSKTTLKKVQRLILATNNSMDKSILKKKKTKIRRQRGNEITRMF